MTDHTNDCEILTTGVCTCRVTAPHPHPSPELSDRVKARALARPRAGTSRTVNTDERVTWLGAHRYVHPEFCAVYSAPVLNWAPYCTCYIKALATHAEPDAVDPEVPKEYRPGTREVSVRWFRSRAPWWVWVTFGLAAGFPVGAWAGFPW